MNQFVSFLSFRSFSTGQICQRWHKDKVANRHCYRFGYKDKVKQTGALPRLSEDAPKLENQVIYEPEAQFAPCRALAGQNDYIDILGEDPDALKPHEVHYHMPKYLRGVSGHENDYQQALKLKAHMVNTAVPEVKPKDWDFLYNRVNRRYKELRKKITDQDLWKNYRGIKAGPAKDRFKTKTF